MTTPRRTRTTGRDPDGRAPTKKRRVTAAQQFAALQREAEWWGITLSAPHGSGPGGAVTADDLTTAIAKVSTRFEVARQQEIVEEHRKRHGPAIHTTPRKPSDVTVTDLFCGAGGSTSGAKKAGARVVMASNHWHLAVDTHGTNHPDTNHDVADISAVNPRRYRPTDILIASPECTNHSTANGKPTLSPQLDAFTEWNPDPAAERSRATAWDVFRFAEVHRYNYIVVENVTCFGRWIAFEQWLASVSVLGYSYRVLSLNSMYFHPCPQSRDRLYVVFWRQGNPELHLDYCPPAWCPACRRNVAAMQTWKVNRRTGRPHRWGKLDVIGGQKGRYFYSCPACRTRVSPYYYCALNALDFSIPAEKIGDRLKPRTRDRIVYGKRKFGRRQLVITANCSTDGGRVRVDADALGARPGGAVSAVVHPPLVVETAFASKGPAEMARSGLDAGRTQTTAETMALAGPPLLVHTRQANGLGHRVRPSTRSGGTQTGDPDFGVAMPPAAVVSTNEFDPRTLPPTAPSGTQTTQEKFGLAYSGAMLVPAGSLEAAPRDVIGAGPGVTGSERLGVAVPEPFIATLPGAGCPQVSVASDELATVCASGNHHALVIDGAALVTLRSAEFLFRGLEAPIGTQVACAPQDYVLSPHEFLITYNGNNLASDFIEGIPTMRTVEGHGIVTPDDDVDDISEWFFRMLDWTEIRASMAFDRLYRILGKKREKVKQLGNAVTPPVMEWIVGQCIEALERSRRATARAA